MFYLNLSTFKIFNAAQINMYKNKRESCRESTTAKWSKSLAAVADPAFFCRGDDIGGGYIWRYSWLYRHRTANVACQQNLITPIGWAAAYPAPWIRHWWAGCYRWGWSHNGKTSRPVHSSHWPWAVPNKDVCTCVSVASVTQSCTPQEGTVIYIYRVETGYAPVRVMGQAIISCDRCPRVDDDATSDIQNSLQPAVWRLRGLCQ